MARNGRGTGKTNNGDLLEAQAGASCVKEPEQQLHQATPSIRGLRA